MKLAENYLIEIYDAKNLCNRKDIESILREFAEYCGCTIIDSKAHFFNPQGYSCVLLLQESHLSIHTWPEYNAAIIDFSTCVLDSATKVENAVQYLARNFDCKLKYTRVDRYIKEPSCENNVVMQSIIAE